MKWSLKRTKFLILSCPFIYKAHFLWCIYSSHSENWCGFCRKWDTEYFPLLDGSHWYLSLLADFVTKFCILLIWIIIAEALEPLYTSRMDPRAWSSWQKRFVPELQFTIMTSWGWYFAEHHRDFISDSNIRTLIMIWARFEGLFPIPSIWNLNSELYPMQGFFQSRMNIIL